MGRFLFYFFILLVFSGLLLHYKVDIPLAFSWIGKLPGDVIVRHGRTLYYFPISTSAFTSVFLTFFLYSFKKKKKQ